MMVQLAPRVTVRQTNLGIQLRTLTGSSSNREIRAAAYGWCIRTVTNGMPAADS